MYDEMVDRQMVAIANVRRLYAQYSPHRPVDDDQSTTVYRLVEQVIKYSQYLDLAQNKRQIIEG